MAPALNPTHAAPAVNDALGSLIGTKYLPGLLSAEVGSLLPWGLSWRNAPAHNSRCPQRAQDRRRRFLSFPAPWTFGTLAVPSNPAGMGPPWEAGTRRLYGAGKTLFSAGMARKEPAWLARPGVAISVPMPRCRIPGADAA